MHVVLLREKPQEAGQDLVRERTLPIQSSVHVHSARARGRRENPLGSVRLVTHTHTSTACLVSE